MTVYADLWGTDRALQNAAYQLLCNLAARSADGRAVEDLPALIEVTHDARFVTARHCLESLWKIGLAGDQCRAAVPATLADRYRAAI